MARKNRNSEDGTIDMTPMIDIVFQLIIFFIVAITIQKDFDREIILAPAHESPIIEGDDPTTFIVEVDKRGWISIYGAQLSKSKLRQIIRRRYNRYGQYPVLIRGDYRTRHNDIRAVMDICSEEGIWRVSFVAIQEKKT
jgi:biopolymer transport protein ExbD